MIYKRILTELNPLKLYFVGLLVVFFISAFTLQERTKELSYQAGEKLTYKLFYNWNFVWLSAGEVIFEVKDEGELYHLEVTGRTYTSYEWFYKVRDKYHSYIDKKTLLPKLYIRDVNQGSYKHYEKIVFDYNKKIIISSTGKSFNELKSKELPITGDIYDMVSAMYFLRNINYDNFRKERQSHFSIILDHEKYKLSLRYLHDDKSLTVRENGKFKVLACLADVVSGNVFKEGAQMKVFIGNDKNRIPVLIESPLSVGSVKAVLKSAENLKYPLDSRVK